MSSRHCLEGAALLMFCMVIAFWVWACSTSTPAPNALAMERIPSRDPTTIGDDAGIRSLERVPLPSRPRPAPPNAEYQRLHSILATRSDRFASLVGSVFGDELSPEAAVSFIPTLERLAQHEDPAIAARALDGLQKLWRTAPPVGSVFDELSPEAAASLIPTLERLAKHVDPLIAARAQGALQRLRRR